MHKPRPAHLRLVSSNPLPRTDGPKLAPLVEVDLVSLSYFSAIPAEDRPARTKSEAKRRPARPGYQAFRKIARKIGATWEQEYADEDLTIKLPDGRTLAVRHDRGYDEDWQEAADYLEHFVSAPEPPSPTFESYDEDGEDWYIAAY